MEEKIKKFCNINDENVLMIVLAFISFSIGIWSNYRQLWLKSIGFDVVSISRILSVALICSAMISFVISIFSTKVKIKSVTLMCIIFRAIALSILLVNRNTYIIKICMLLSIMCDVMFSGKITDHFALFCRFDIFGWRKMVRNHRDLVLVKHICDPHFFHFPHFLP